MTAMYLPIRPLTRVKLRAMDVQHLQDAITSLGSELTTQFQKVQQAQAKLARAHRDMTATVDRYQEILGAIKAVRGLLEAKDERPVSTPAKVIDALNQAEGPLRDLELLESMVEAGWDTESGDPLALLRSTLSRMIKNDQVVRVATATYDLPARAVASANGQWRSSWQVEHDDDEGDYEDSEMSSAPTEARALEPISDQGGS